MTVCEHLTDIMPCVDPTMQATFMDQKVKDTNNRIDKEVSVRYASYNEGS